MIDRTIRALPNLAALGTLWLLSHPRDALQPEPCTATMQAAILAGVWFSMRFAPTHTLHRQS